MSEPYGITDNLARCRLCLGPISSTTGYVEHRTGCDYAKLQERVAALQAENQELRSHLTPAEEALGQRIKALEAQLAQVQATIEKAEKDCSDLCSAVRTALTTQLRRLTEALRKYGQHFPRCLAPYCADLFHPNSCTCKPCGRCTCGLDAALTGGT